VWKLAQLRVIYSPTIIGLIMIEILMLLISAINMAAAVTPFLKTLKTL
jgi:hypothetical protein